MKTMMMKFTSLLIAGAAFLLAVAAIAAVSAAAAHDPFPVLAYGYVPISAADGSAIFYMLRGNPKLTSAERAKLPLVNPISGGPGASSISFMMMIETGPQKITCNLTNESDYTVGDRTTAWTEFANVLYIDTPVGTGWSYTQSSSGFATSDQQTAADYVTFMKGFLLKHPEFNNHPQFHIHGESYSGKASLFYANAMLKSGLPLKVTSVTSADGWVSPIDAMKSYGPYLHAFSMIDSVQSKNLTDLAEAAEKKLNAGDGNGATNLWGVQQSLYEYFTGGVNVYDVRYYSPYFCEQSADMYMNSAAWYSMFNKSTFPAGVSFGSQGGQVFGALGKAFMTDGIAQAQELINAGVKLCVYVAQMDLIVDTLSVSMWMNKLPWSKLAQFQHSHRHAVSGIFPKNSEVFHVDLYYKKYENLAFVQNTGFAGCGHVLAGQDCGEIAKWMTKWVLSGFTDKQGANDREITAPRNKKPKFV